MPPLDATSQQTLATLQDEVGRGCVNFIHVVDVNGGKAGYHRLLSLHVGDISIYTYPALSTSGSTTSEQLSLTQQAKKARKYSDTPVKGRLPPILLTFFLLFLRQLLHKP